MAEVLQTLFHGSFAEQEPAENFSSVSAGPAANNVWEIDVVYLCSQAGSEIAVTLKKVLASTDEVMILHVTNILPGETVTIGPMAMAEGDALEVNVIGGTVDMIAYGREIDTTV